ncbi:MAG: acyloxyacyl hydrolase [Porticoccaceae bacterium]
MSKRTAAIWAATMFGLGLAAAAPAASQGARVTLGAVAFGVFDATIRGAVNIGWEGGELPGLWSIRPALQLIARPQDNWYLGAGGVREFALADAWHWGLGAGAGVYHQGGGKDLGQPLEFHTRAYLGWRPAPGQQVRLEIEHISNADLGKINPGVDLLSLNWVFGL